MSVWNTGAPGARPSIHAGSPPWASWTNTSTCLMLIFPASASFSNSSLISNNSPAIQCPPYLGRDGSKTKRNCRARPATARNRTRTGATCRRGRRPWRRSSGRTRTCRPRSIRTCSASPPGTTSPCIAGSRRASWPAAPMANARRRGVDMCKRGLHDLSDPANAYVRPGTTRRRAAVQPPSANFRRQPFGPHSAARGARREGSEGPASGDARRPARPRAGQGNGWPEELSLEELYSKLN